MAKQENILKVFPLKSLHNKYGVDWQRKDLIKCYKHEGSFTIKGLIKEFNINSKDLVFVCIQYKYKDSYLDRIKTKYTTISLQLQSDSPKYNIESGYVTKGEVEKIRKQEDIVAYVVAVDSTNIIPVTEHETSLWNLTRFECDENTRFIYKPSIGRLYLNGYKYSTWREQRGSLEQALDKSGYSIIRKRRNLQSKLRDMHEKRLKEVVSSAFNKENAELFSKIIEVKKKLAEKVLQANTEADMQNVVDNFRIITRVMGIYEKHIQKLQNVNNVEASYYSKYNSIREVEKEIKDMYTQLACVKID